MVKDLTKDNKTLLFYDVGTQIFTKKHLKYLGSWAAATTRKSLITLQRPIYQLLKLKKNIVTL